jgi:hypothetical protein
VKSRFERRQQAWPTHLDSVRRHVIDQVQGLHLPTLTSALQRFADEAQMGAVQQDLDETPSPVVSTPLGVRQ